MELCGGGYVAAPQGKLQAASGEDDSGAGEVRVSLRGAAYAHAVQSRGAAAHGAAESAEPAGKGDRMRIGLKSFYFCPVFPTHTALCCFFFSKAVQ